MRYIKCLFTKSAQARGRTMYERLHQDEEFDVLTR